MDHSDEEVRTLSVPIVRQMMYPKLILYRKIF